MGYEELHLKKIRSYLAECMVLLRYDGKFPLNNPSKIALYGSGARKTIKGGTGSGEVNSRYFINIEEGLEHEGFEIVTKDWLDSYDNEYLKNKKRFKKELKKIAKEKNQPLFIAAMGEVMNEVEYDISIDVRCDTAIYVLSRISGEASDRRKIKGDVFLTDTEIRNINYLNDNYKKFMLIINTGGVVDLTPVVNVKNILISSQLGVEMGYAIADVLLGRETPSGKLTTSWTKYADYQNIGEFGEPDDTKYKEGIYVGYRYFDSVNLNVDFPFGYGLSYTKFDIKYLDTIINNNIITIKANVKNIGNYKGKEVLELYVSKPNDRIDQAYQELISFEKTCLLNPNDECELSLSFDLNDITTYDTDKATYTLLKGEYILRLGNSSRNTKIISVLDFDNDISIKRVKNHFKKPDYIDFIGRNTKDDINNVKHYKIDLKEDLEVIDYDINYEILDEIKGLSDEDLVKLNMGLFNEAGGLKGIIEQKVSVPGAAGETYKCGGLKNIVMADGPQGLRLARSYFVDKNGPHSTSGLIPESVREYMPKWMRLFLYLVSPKPKKNEIKYQYTTALPISTAVAQSFNKDFAYLCGDIVGFEMEIFNVDLWLAPALNIHRNILCGRNFEYYSEDPYLSGMIASNITRGVESHKGKGVTIKHFLCNNQEFNRYVNNSIVSERAIREIYLKGFELCIKYAKPKAVMTSYNLLNGIHTSENIKINEKILRCELKHNGFVMTDWVVRFMQNEYKYKNATPINVIKAHGDIFMPGSKYDYELVMDGLKKGLVQREDLEINASRLYKVIKELKD